MKPRLAGSILLLNLLLLSCSNQPEGDPPREPVFDIAGMSAADRIEIQNQEESTLIDVQSPTGIGSARFELEEGDMPARLVVRLHLGGLEDFRISSSSGETTIAASFSTSEVFNRYNQRIILSGREFPITPLHPLWLEMRVVSEEAARSVPLKEGYFEITLPAKFLEEAVGSFEMRWIDFYR